MMRRAPPRRAESMNRSDSLVANSCLAAWEVPLRVQSKATAKARSTAADRSVRPTCLPGQAQRAFDRLNHLRTHFRARVEGAEFIVKNLAHQRGVTKDSSGHGHRDRGRVGFGEQAAEHDGGKLGKFAAGAGENLRGQIVRAGGDRGKERSKIGRRNCVAGAGEIGERGYSPSFQESGGERG